MPATSRHWSRHHYDAVVFQHPMYWYSVPPLLKQWFDTTLAEGWAYGSGASAIGRRRRPTR